LEKALDTARTDSCTSDAEPSALWRPYKGGPEPKDKGPSIREVVQPVARPRPPEPSKKRGTR
jgi:hypothetical protein